MLGHIEAIRVANSAWVSRSNMLSAGTLHLMPLYCCATTVLLAASPNGFASAPASILWSVLLMESVRSWSGVVLLCVVCGSVTFLGIKPKKTSLKSTGKRNQLRRGTPVGKVSKGVGREDWKVYAMRHSRCRLGLARRCRWKG